MSDGKNKKLAFLLFQEETIISPKQAFRRKSLNIMKDTSFSLSCSPEV